MKWNPRIAYNYGAAVTINLTLSSSLYEPEEGAEGELADEDTSAAGIPESYVVRWDQCANVTLRFTDAEAVSVRTFLELAVKNKGTSFTFRLDQNDAATSYTCYLERPRAGERIKFRRVDDGPWWEVDITIRSTNGTRIHNALPTT